MDCWALLASFSSVKLAFLLPAKEVGLLLTTLSLQEDITLTGLKNHQGTVLLSVVLWKTILAATYL